MELFVHVKISHMLEKWRNAWLVLVCVYICLEVKLFSLYIMQFVTCRSTLVGNAALQGLGENKF